MEQELFCHLFIDKIRFIKRVLSSFVKNISNSMFWFLFTCSSAGQQLFRIVLLVVGLTIEICIMNHG